MSGATSGLVAHAQEIVNKLSKSPQFNEKMRNVLEDLSDLAKDLAILANRTFTSEWEFDDFVLEFDWDDGAFVKMPSSRLEVGFINIQCLKAKSVYECLKELFGNKQEIFEKVLKEFTEKLDSYIEILKEVLTEEDP